MIREGESLNQSKDLFNLNHTYRFLPTSSANSLHFHRQSTSTNPTSRSH